MDEYQTLVSSISLAMGVAWASGINLYAAILVLGILGASGNLLLPADLQVLSSPIILVAAGLMFTIEFFADKIPGIDTGWDSVHTFIRIPAGAILAASAVGQLDPALAIAAGLLGGGVSAVTHAAKAGTRLCINASPEPLSNWTASIGEDIAVVGGLWIALKHPWLFLALLLLFLLFLIWLLPKIWRAIKKAISMLLSLFRSRQVSEESCRSDEDGCTEDRSVEETGNEDANN